MLKFTEEIKQQVTNNISNSFSFYCQKLIHDYKITLKFDTTHESYNNDIPLDILMLQCLEQLEYEFKHNLKEHLNIDEAILDIENKEQEQINQDILDTYRNI